MARRGGYISWRWMVLGAASIVAVFIVALAAVRSDLHQLRAQESSLVLQLQLLETDYESLAEELERVGTDSYIENAARENYGFIMDGEIIFAFQNPEKLQGYTEEEYRIIQEEMRD